MKKNDSHDYFIGKDEAYVENGTITRIGDDSTTELAKKIYIGIVTQTDWAPAPEDAYIAAEYAFTYADVFEKAKDKRSKR